MERWWSICLTFDQYCYLLLAAGSSIGLTLHVQFSASDDGRKNRLKHVERLTEINKLWNVATCWLYSAKELLDWIGIDHEMNVRDVHCGKRCVSTHSLEIGLHYMSINIRIIFVVIYISNAMTFVLDIMTCRITEQTFASWYLLENFLFDTDGSLLWFYQFLPKGLFLTNKITLKNDSSASRAGHRKLTYSL